MKDAKIISGDFFEPEIPKEKKWLLNYFRTPIQEQFLKYYLVFEEFESFKEHTGINADLKYLKRLRTKYHTLLDMHATAKKNFEVEELWIIETGGKKIH